MRKNIFIFLIVGFLFLSPSVYSQSEAFFLGYGSGVGGRALSMGSAYLAIADDYSATLWNPAGLTQLRRMELFASLSHSQFMNEATFQGSSNTDKTSKTNLNSVGFAFPIPTYRGSLVFAVGYNRVRNFDSGFSFSQFVNDPGVQQDYTEIEEGGLNNWVFSGAMEMTPNLSIGGSLNLWRGKDDYHLNLFDQDVQNLFYYKDFSYDQQLVTDYSGVNFKFGALYKFLKVFRFAATIATPVTLNADEKWRETTQQTEDADSPYDDYEETESSSWKYKIRAPFVFAAGSAVTLLPNIVLSADVEYTDWSQTRYLSEPPVGDEFKQNLNFKQDFDQTITYRFGGEFTVPLINTQLRAGMIRQPSPLVNASSKADRNYLTLGGGILLDKQVKIDFAWVRGWWEKEGSYFSDDLPSVNEKINLDKFFATMSIRF
ncbi:outer membrane protein transport protein [candidate division KSB1 bacterium]|nr:outer membrane protein transport protein [candidate division KSB1 bacterium]